VKIPDLFEEKSDLKFYIEYQGEKKQITGNDLIKIFKEKQ